MKKKKLLWLLIIPAVLAVCAAVFLPGSVLTGYLADERVERVELTMTRETSAGDESLACITLDGEQQEELLAVLKGTWFRKFRSPYARESEYRYYIMGYNADGVAVVEMKITDGKRVELHYAPGDGPQIHRNLVVLGESLDAVLETMMERIV